MTDKPVSRFLYAILLALTIAVGLLSRTSFVPANTPLGKFAGDTLWAVALYWSLTIIFTRWQPWKLALLTTLLAFAVECSQLYHAEWIDQIRAMKLGGLLLGNTFHWPDLPCYAGGAYLACAIDSQLIRKYIQHN